MKQLFRQYGSVAALLALITALAVLVTLLTGGFALGGDRDEGKQVLATTYPLYVAAQQILGDDTAVTLTRLDGAASGCLHDYQLSPADRRAVQEADLILMNGAGAESFLHGIAEEDKQVDTSAGLDLLCAAHHHDHGEEEHHHEEEYNEHVWLSPARYMGQVRMIFQALCGLNPEKAHIYSANTADYQMKIAAIQQEMEQLAVALDGTPRVLFHDSMAYLAADLGLDVKLTLSVEGESGLSAHDLGQVEQLAAQHPDLLLLYDTQYALRYEGLAGNPLTLNTAVQGTGDPADWLTAMGENVENLKKSAADRSAKPQEKGGDAP